MFKVTATQAANGWSKEHIQHLLLTNDKAVERALVQLFNRQTASEQRAKETQVHNNVGFSSSDGAFLSSVAQHCIYGRGLSPAQMYKVRPKIIKYWKQLLEIASQSPTGPSFPRPAPLPKKTRGGTVKKSYPAPSRHQQTFSYH